MHAKFTDTHTNTHTHRHICTAISVRPLHWLPFVKPNSKPYSDPNLNLTSIYVLPINIFALKFDVKVVMSKILSPQKLLDPTPWVKIQVLDPTNIEKQTHTHTHTHIHTHWFLMWNSAVVLTDLIRPVYIWEETISVDQFLDSHKHSTLALQLTAHCYKLA